MIWICVLPGPEAGSTACKQGRARSACHTCLKQMAADMVGCHSAQLSVMRNEFGKPRFQHPVRARTLDFSISHTTGISIVAISAAGKIGVDVEGTDTKEARDFSIDEFLTHSERSYFDARSQTAPEHHLKIWTRKEAVLKALGFGLVRGTEAAPLCGTLLDGGCHIDPQMPYRLYNEGLSVCDIDVGRGAVASMATSANCCSYRKTEWHL